MQSHDSHDQCPAKEPADGRWDAQRGADQETTGVEPAQVPDVGNGTVCLSAGIGGKGYVAA